jgi:glucose-6-phosphate isomerase, archaeal
MEFDVIQRVSLIDPPAAVNLHTWHLEGTNLVESLKRLGDLPGIFRDARAFALMDPDTVVYRVQAYMPTTEGTEGGLYFGTTVIEPGTVGGEYFMTRGHSHARADRAEFYWGVKGQGVLLLLTPGGTIRAERISAGSLHYIDANTAHRVANTGDEPLIFGASWPSDAGHNYAEIASQGFGARVVIGASGTPEIIVV